MDSGLQIFKHIDCPAGAKCTSVRCLFRHAGDASVGVETNANSVSKGDGANDGASGAVAPAAPSPEGPSSKRLKTGKEEYDPTAPVVPFLDEDTLPDDGDIFPDSAEPLSKSPVLAATVPSDPVPVLKRKHLEASPGEDNTQSVTPTTQRHSHNNPFSSSYSTPKSQQQANNNPFSTRKHSPVSTTPAPEPTVAPLPKPEPTPAPARKAEGLNPRHLRNQPATFQVRWKLVKMLYDQYTRLNQGLEKIAQDDATKRLLLTDQEIIWMALDEEENAAKTNGYSNQLKSRITSCKKFTVEKWKEERIELLRKQEAALFKDESAAAPKSSEPVVIETGLTATQEVQLVKARLLTPIDDLAKYGYVPTVPAEEEIAKAKQAQSVSQGWEGCDRCTKRFQVFPGRREEDGALASGGKCTHHPGKLYMPNRQSADRSIPERQYRCCGETVGQSVGCTVKDTHVFRHSDPKQLATLWNFAETPENPNAPKDRGVCFDCEMGYTVKGFEMIRFTATSWPSGEELMDVLVRPFGEVLDLNSQYSGVWPEDLANARPFALASDKPLPPQKAGERKRLQMVSSPEVARDLLFSLISRDTPLMGHGLENDLNCMRVVHPVIVDTVLLYPHNRGLPIRNGLRMLMQTILNTRIQVEPAEGQLAGHDSAEDARAAGDLVRWKTRKEWLKMKREGWTLVDGQFVSPAKTTMPSILEA